MTSIIRDDFTSIREKLLSIEKEFQERLTEVEIKTKDFRDLDRKLEEKKNEKDFPIKINVGGKIFVCKLSTILGVKDTIFYNLFANYVKQGLEIPKELFFDRNYTHFPIIMEYLRHKNISLKNYKKFEREDVIEELEFYGIDLFSKNKQELDIEWDMTLSKSGACSIKDDPRILSVHSTGCYTHFVTNRVFTDENFIIEFESTVTQTDNYYYIGIINESYSTSGSCGCCNPSNSYYIQCDGSTHINANRGNSLLSWHSQPCIIGMRVLLSDKTIYFYKDTPENEIGPFNIVSGTNFRVYAGHCNSGNGELKILTCRLI
jgi:hypothetical protein